MKQLILREVCILVLTATPLLAAEKPDDCEITPQVNDWTQMKICQNKKVKLQGEIATEVFQHPIGLHDSFDLQKGVQQRKFENYVTVGQSQVVITSDKKIECRGKIEFEGLVDLIDLGGEKGSKGNYKNIWIKVLNYKCK